MSWMLHKEELRYFVNHRLKEYRMWSESKNDWMHFKGTALSHSFFMVLDYGQHRLCRIPFGELQVYHSPITDRNRFQEYDLIENVKLGKKSGQRFS
jgi:hypothetical protein